MFDRLYRGRYRLDGEERIREVPLKTPDKQIAEQRLNKIILDEQREREGLLAPKAERDAAKRRYAQHVEDFIETRRSVGRDEKYVKELRKKLLRLGQECSWEYPKDVSALAFEAWRAPAIGMARFAPGGGTALRERPGLDLEESQTGDAPLAY